MVILICGYRKTGKDMLYQKLSRKAPLDLFSWSIYASPLVDSSKVYNDFNTGTYIRQALADKLKSEANTQYSISSYISDNEKDIKQFIHPITKALVSARDIYIEWGEKRRGEDPEYWCKCIEKPLLGETVVITDWRHPNERDYFVNEYGNVITMRVYRGDVIEPPKNVISEHDLDNVLTDYVLIFDKPGEWDILLEHFPQYQNYVLVSRI